MTAHEIDDLITSAARDMTRMETAGFGARVRARLESPARRLRLTYLGAAAATMAAIAVTVGLNPSLTVPEVAAPARVDLASFAAPIVGALMSSPAAPAGRSAVAPDAPAGHKAWLTRTVPALAPTPPLALAPIDAVGIRIAHLAIDPLGAAGAIKQDTTVK
jgi:hypothetical protein